MLFPSSELRAAETDAAVRELIECLEMGHFTRVSQAMRLDGRMVASLLQTELPMAKVICRAAAENLEQRSLNAEEMLHDLDSLAAALDRTTRPQYSLYNSSKLRSLRTSGALPPLSEVL